MSHSRTIVWEICKGIQVKDGINQETGFWCNVGHGKIILGRVGGRVEGINQTQEEEDIMCGGGSGCWGFWRFKGRGIFTHITKGDAAVLGRYQNKERAITCDDDPAGGIQRIYGKKVAHGAIGG